MNACIWNLEKWYRWTYLQARNKDADASNRHVDTGGEEEGGANWERSIAVYPLAHVKQLVDSVGLSGIAQAAQLGAPWWLQGAMRGGREVQEQGDICRHTADSLHCTAENNSIVKQLYSNKKRRKRNSDFKDILQKHWVIVWWLVCKNCFILGTNLSDRILNILPKYFPG